jgi:nicotinamide mononucleotide (NMN) deamidase PncC
MARGVRRLLGADIAISATGIAGPTGGTPEKPVGLVYVALAAEDFEQS